MTYYDLWAFRIQSKNLDVYFLSTPKWAIYACRPMNYQSFRKYTSLSRKCTARDLGKTFYKTEYLITINYVQYSIIRIKNLKALSHALTLVTLVIYANYLRLQNWLSCGSKFGLLSSRARYFVSGNLSFQVLMKCRRSRPLGRVSVPLGYPALVKGYMSNRLLITVNVHSRMILLWYIYFNRNSETKITESIWIERLFWT